MGNAYLEEICEENIDKFIRWGSSGSEAMLDYPSCFFHIPHSKGIIAYRLVDNTAVVFGDPICPKEDIPSLVNAFHLFCSETNKEVIYIIATKDFAEWLGAKYCKIAIEVCEELVLDPSSTQRSKRLNYRLNQAQKCGLSFHEYRPFNEEIEKGILEVGKVWYETKNRTQIHLGHLNFFEHRQGKRWFYILQNGEITGMAMLVKQEARNGWLLKFLFMKPHSAQYTSELLVCQILKTLNDEGCHFLTIGMVPVPSLQKIKGLGKIATWLVKTVFAVIKKVFKLDQKKIYWLRYRPKEEPLYILFSNSRIGINSIKALLKALKMN